MASKPPGNQSPVSKVYQTVIEDVINNVREAFLDDGIDEHVLQELKSTWETKLFQSKAVDNPQTDRLGQHALPLYVNAPLVYKALPEGMSAIQMTPAGQQAALALPTSVPIVYQPALPNASTQAQLYTPYQPGAQARQPKAQTLLVAQRPKEETSSSGQNQPSAIIQVDGASDNNTVAHEASCSKENPTFDRSFCGLKCRFKATKKPKNIPQVDGGGDSSSSEDDDDDDDEDEEDDDEDEDEAEEKTSESVNEPPLGSDDDGTDEDPVELFDTDNVVVCQYDKIHRAKARWKFHLKLGIMNLNGKDYVFQKATGEAEW